MTSAPLPARARSAVDAVNDVGHRAPGNPTTASAPHRIAKLTAMGAVQGRWLDVGCGSGSYSRLLADAGADHVVGIDLGLRSPLERVERTSFAVCASERLPFSDDHFDGVLINEVLEHVDDEAATLREIRRILHPDGRLVVFSPNRWFPFEGHGAIMGSRTIDRPVPLLPWLPAALTRRWMRARNYWPSELRHLVEDAGFNVATVAFAYPLFIEYPWLPPPIADRARTLAPRLEETPIVRRLGVSTMLDARPV
jgi:SAM-dependent methyltransferase